MKNGMWQNCEKNVCDRWCVKLCVEDGIWQNYMRKME